MSFTPKTWQDYQPNSLTNTPITAAELNRIEQGVSGAYTAMANYVKDPFRSMFPEYTQTSIYELIASGSTLLDTPPTFKIPASQFDPTRDGIMIWVNTVTPVYSIYYSFSTATISGTDYVVITFEQSQSALFTVGAQVLFMLFEKPPDSGGETAVVNGYLPAQRAFTTPVRFSGAGLTSYEICVCFRATVMPTASRPNTFFGASGYFFNAPSCEINNQGIWHGFAYSGNGWGYDVLTPWNNCPITLDGTMQWIKVTWDSTSCKQTLLHSTDGVTYTEISSFSTPSTAYTPSGDGDYIVIGGVANNGSHSFQEGNDINIFNSYIKLNGDLVFGREVTA